MHSSHQTVFKCLLESVTVILSFHRVAGREFKRPGPAAEKLLSPVHVSRSIECSDHRRLYQTGTGPAVVTEVVWNLAMYRTVDKNGQLKLNLLPSR